MFLNEFEILHAYDSAASSSKFTLLSSSTSKSKQAKEAAPLRRVVLNRNLLRFAFLDTLDILLINSQTASPETVQHPHILRDHIVSAIALKKNMVCPICVTTAIIVNAPAIAAGVAGTAAAVQGKKMYNRVQNKEKIVLTASVPKISTPPPRPPQDKN